MKKIVYLLVACLFAGYTMADEYTDSLANFQKSPQVSALFSSAYGYAIFPAIGKGGFGLGGAYGEGKVYKQGVQTGDVSMVQVTLGFQLGGQAFSEIIFFQDKEAYDKFTSNGFEFSAQASAVAITAGAQAQTSTTGTSAGAGKKAQAGNYSDGMATFTYAIGGLMFEAALGGQKFSFVADNN